MLQGLVWPLWARMAPEGLFSCSVVRAVSVGCVARCPVQFGSRLQVGQRRGQQVRQPVVWGVGSGAVQVERSPGARKLDKQRNWRTRVRRQRLTSPRDVVVSFRRRRR